jgi:hypothetical protein
MGEKRGKVADAVLEERERDGRRIYIEESGRNRRAEYKRRRRKRRTAHPSPYTYPSLSFSL